ncbi:2Fe-2S iron-sulfur cluster-binding protein [Tardiphaga sp.]|uniref:2Fe-2S iron-sulfur cluster-binding protein n=1 Tax=Tardiphaga sp. TaxID=1926292 RepID=UPI0026179C3B|nr:2Fe-2S iron-sulfur cluster-binding protein [Tardiphaga sp.]MDB5620378.1 Ferredoxin-6 [Tardiphaga sp.]
MTTITVCDASGATHVVECDDGVTVMEALRPLDLGVAGDCEGSVACATCHVWVEGDWLARTGEPADPEADMLDCAFHVRPNSRLSCRIVVTPELDGLQVTVPA